MKTQEIMKIRDERGNPVCSRTYFRVTGKVKSPLLIGSGENQETDMDVLVDAYGKPFLPGTSLAGALKHAAEAFLSQEKAETLFGKPQRNRDNGCQSRVFVYDAALAQAKMSLRDGVRLDEFKTAVDMAKYEMQVVEAGAAFSFCLTLVEREQDAEADEAVKDLQTLLSHLALGDITLGAKSRRGFGRLAVDEIKIKKFSMKEQDERNAWLDWDWRDEKAFDDALAVKLGTAEEMQLWEHCLCVPLNVKHTLLIRQYPKKLSDTMDYQQLQSGNKAVIPGSSWMGAIRAHIVSIMRQINPALDVSACQQELGDFFGTEVEKEKEKAECQASWVKVAESVICDAKFLTITRNAIDRFTGGTVSGALYTAKVAVQGSTTLQLRWSRASKKDPAVLCGLLFWAVRDLQAGLLAVGGETAVGRGIFSEAAEPVRLDGVAVTAEQEKEFVRAAAQWCKKAREA